MEIAVLPDHGLRIKGKHASLGIDTEKDGYNALMTLHKDPGHVKVPEESLLIVGPGEYEVGGIKISGIRSDGEDAYSAKVDGVDVLMGKLSSLEKLQHKLKEFNIVTVLCDSDTNPSFLTALTSNAILFYGKNAEQVAGGFSKESVKSMPKYITTADKLPQEVETVILE